MKALTSALILILALVLTTPAIAGTPRVEARQQRQEARIDEGMASGELTRRESRRLNAQQAHIQRIEHRVNADGVVTTRERVRLQHEQNQASRQIRRNKHDWARRY